MPLAAVVLAAHECSLGIVRALTLTTKSAGGSLGRSLVKSRNKKKANRRTKLADRKARSNHRNAETGQYEDYGGMTGLASVTELNSLDEFISHARMADRQFATERNQVTVVEDSMIGGSDAALGRASAVNVEHGGTNSAAAGAVTIESLKVRSGRRKSSWSCCFACCCAGLLVIIYYVSQPFLYPFQILLKIHH